jgi:hypothetical protein
MPVTRTKAVAELCGLYHVDATHNRLIHKKDDFKGRLRVEGDLVICLGGGQYMVLKVDGRKLTGLPEYTFMASPLGVAHDWKPSEKQLHLLHGGLSITAPVDLAPHVVDDPVQGSRLSIMGHAGGQDE